jgi:Ca2+-transporting ATPase
MLSLAKEVISRKNTKLFHTESSSSSNTTLDIIEPLITQHNYGTKTKVSDSVDKTKLADMVKDKNLKSLTEFGGVEGIGHVLGTVHDKGIIGSDDDISRRLELFGSNTYKKPPPKGLLHFVLEAFNDTTIIILLVCAGLSLGFGIKEHGAGEGWYEGGSISCSFSCCCCKCIKQFQTRKTIS